jgi:N utilization substance protein B
MGIRHQGRELALQALYRIDICGGASNEDLRAFFDSFTADPSARRFAMQLIDGVAAEIPGLDARISATLEHWSITRLSRVDHNILRLALFELLHMDEIPARVTIDEAIELAKSYGDHDSGRFVNGVLDEIAGRLNLKQKGEPADVSKAE